MSFSKSSKVIATSKWNMVATVWAMTSIRPAITFGSPDKPMIKKNQNSFRHSVPGWRTRKFPFLFLLGLSLLPQMTAVCANHSNQRQSLTPQLALQLITIGLRKPYVGSAIFFDADGVLEQDTNIDFARFMMKQHLMTCEKISGGDFARHCRITEQGRRSPYFGITRDDGKTSLYIRLSEDRNPRLLTSRFTDPRAVRFRFTRVDNRLGSMFSHSKPTALTATAEFVFKNGKWTLAGINGMPGD
jgi:hypothetical protein